MAFDRLKLDGKVAIITGGAKGVGRGIASVLSEAGAAVVLTSRTAADVDSAVREIEAAGGQALGVPGDVTKAEALERIVQATLDRFGRIDIVVNNAGGTTIRSFFDLTEDDFHRDFQFNAVAPFKLAQLAAPHMRKNADGGSVINISSGAGQAGGTDMLSYSVAKAALEQLTKMMALELRPDIRVNALALGAIISDTLREYLDAHPVTRDRLTGSIALGRLGEPEQIGLAVLYLSAPTCYSNGSVMTVDGGIDRRTA